MNVRMSETGRSLTLKGLGLSAAVIVQGRHRAARVERPMKFPFWESFAPPRDPLQKVTFLRWVCFLCKHCLRGRKWRAGSPGCQRSALISNARFSRQSRDDSLRAEVL